MDDDERAPRSGKESPAAGAGRVVFHPSQPAAASNTSVPTLLRIRGLEKRYGRTHALRGVSLDLAPGSLIALLGPNGAGKTTLVRIILGLERPSRGSVTLRPDEALGKGEPQRVRMGYAPEIAPVEPRRTGFENLAGFAMLTGMDKQAAAAQGRAWLDRVGLDAHGDRQAGGYSKGMRQRLSLARAFVHDPDLVVLDEPSSGLDPSGRVEVREIIGQAAGPRTSVLLATHDVHEAAALADRVIIMDGGLVRWMGAVRDPETILSRYREVVEG